MLTVKQKELLQFIKERLDATGVPPSFDEMKEALDLKSKSGIHRLITALEERGFIRRLPHRARALEVLKFPESLKRDGASEPGFRPSVIEGGGGRCVEPLPGFDGRQAAMAPVMGRIAAGVPISAIQDHSHDLEVYE